MPASTRRALGAVVAALGLILVVVGAWIVVTLGPSGEASFSAIAKSPGAIVIPSEVLNAVDAPVHVSATRPDGRPVRLAVASSTDAREILASSAVSTVSAVHFPAGTINLRASGTGTLGDITGTDVWRVVIQETGTALMVVDQARAPETVVVTSGDATALTGVTLTLSWAQRAWFFEALAMATLGAVVAAFAMNDLWQGRAATHGDVVAAKPAPVTA